VQGAVKGAGFFPVAGIVGRGRIACQHIALGNKTCNKCAVGAEEKDWVQSYEERGNYTSKYRLPSDADIGADGCEEQVQCCDQGG
jgi:hypothetical protein